MNGIINLFANIQANTNNHTGLESVTLSKYFEAHYIGKKGRTNKDIENYLDIFEIQDINVFENIFLQLSQPNFFGGVISEDTIEKVKKVACFDGNLFVLCNDPRIKPLNPAKCLFDRDENCISEDFISKWNNLLKNAKFLFPGKDLNKFYKSKDFSEFVYFNYFSLIFKDKLNPIIKDFDKQFDVVYYGDRRGSYREKQVVKYMPINDNSLLIGFKQNKIKVNFLEKQKHDDLINILDFCKVSLILSDEEHENNVITFRLYETLASNCLAAIPIEFDPNKEIIKDEILKNILYVKNKKDVENLVKIFSIDLIKRQHEEFKRLINKNIYEI